jgi:Flp pilus assembly protein TadG
MARRWTLSRSFSRAACRFGSDKKGTSAVEFALIGGPFFMMIFAVIETALMFFAQQALETATQDTARMIMTGEAQNFTPAQFKTALCDKLATFLSCTGIRIASQSFSDFSNIVPFNPIDASGQFVATFPYSAGGSGTIMLVQVSYKWPLYVTGLGYSIGNADGTHRLLTATAAFRNEPY